VGGDVVTKTNVIDRSPGALPRTGDPSIPLVVAGAVLLALGLGFVLVSRFRERRTHA
jgi:LPXTG-motif cell wall-anchored protein